MGVGSNCGGAGSNSLLLITVSFLDWAKPIIVFLRNFYSVFFNYIHSFFYPIHFIFGLSPILFFFYFFCFVYFIYLFSTLKAIFFFKKERRKRIDMFMVVCDAVFVWTCPESLNVKKKKLKLYLN